MAKKQLPMFRVQKIMPSLPKPVVRPEGMRYAPTLVGAVLFAGDKTRVLFPADGFLSDISVLVESLPEGKKAVMALTVSSDGTDSTVRMEFGAGLTTFPDTVPLAKGQVMMVVMEDAPEGCTGLFSALFNINVKLG